LTFNEVGTTSPENWHRFQDTEADEILAAFAKSTDEAEQHELINQLQMLYVEKLPAIPIFPGPQWGEFTTLRFTDFPSEENPYTTLPTWAWTERLITMTTIKPVAAT
jgi:peptide/nickel transport system substrate-binding protein